RQIVQNCSFRDKLVRHPVSKNRQATALAWITYAEQKLQHGVTQAQSELVSQGQRHAQAIVRVFETRWKRAPCSAAAEFNLMAPRAASRNTSSSGARALGIFLRRIVIITGIVIVAAPFMNAFAHVVKPEVVGSVGTHPLRPAGFQIVTGIGSIRGRLIAPW